MLIHMRMRNTLYLYAHAHTHAHAHTRAHTWSHTRTYICIYGFMDNTHMYTCVSTTHT